MNSLINFGIALITAFQSIGAWLEAPMEFFSFLGSEIFFLIFMPLIYWSIDSALGVRIWFISMVGVSLNQLFKMAIHSPRPYWVSTDVRAIGQDTGFGIPSGHAEVAAGLWGMIAAYYRKTWVWISIVVLVFLIGLSRLFLGVHFPHDVLIGWALGFLTLWAFIKLWEPVESRIKKMSPWNQVGLAFVVSLVIVSLGALIIFLSGNFVLPTEWIANAIRAGIELPSPFTVSMETLITTAGTLFGASSGLAWTAWRGGFNATGLIWKRGARYLLGMIVVLVIYAGLRAIFPSGDTLVGYIFRYIRYTLVGFWISGGAPWVFARINLTTSQ